MKILLMNTAGPEGVVALADDQGLLVEETLPGRGTSEHLMPAVRRLFGGMGWTVRDLSAVAVVNGPGSFTGIRVGLSACKGLCEAGGVRLIALSRLALVATEAGQKGKVVALLDGGRGEYYGGVFDEKEGSASEVSPERLFRDDEARELMKAWSAVTSEPRVAEVLGPRVTVVAEPGAAAMLAMAKARIAAGAWSDVALTDANYLRRTDAELAERARER